MDTSYLQVVSQYRVRKVKQPPASLISIRGMTIMLINLSVRTSLSQFGVDSFRGDMLDTSWVDRVAGLSSPLQRFSSDHKFTTLGFPKTELECSKDFSKDK